MKRDTEWAVNLFAILLLIVAITHYGYDPICTVVPFLGHSAKGVFYILRGFEGAILFAVIWYLRPALWAVCLWGLLEEGETAVCRIAAGFPGVPVATAWSGLCGDLTGLPLYMLGIVYAAILVTRERPK